MADLTTIKNWFKTGLKPTQAHFWSMLDSFRHKDDKIPLSEVDGINSSLNLKVDKENGKGLSELNFTQTIQDRIDALGNLKTIAVDLGTITTPETAVNALDPSLTVGDDEIIVFSAIENDIKVTYLFNADRGIYGLNDLQVTHLNFVNISGGVNTPTLDEILKSGNQSLEELIIGHDGNNGIHLEPIAQQIALFQGGSSYGTAIDPHKIINEKSGNKIELNANIGLKYDVFNGECITALNQNKISIETGKNWGVPSLEIIDTKDGYNDGHIKIGLTPDVYSLGYIEYKHYHFSGQNTYTLYLPSTNGTLVTYDEITNHNSNPIAHQSEFDKKLDKSDYNAIIELSSARAFTTDDSGKVIVVKANENISVPEIHGLPIHWSINVRYAKGFSGGVSLTNVLTEGGQQETILLGMDSEEMIHCYINEDGEFCKSGV